jgi:hypothetical protein
MCVARNMRGWCQELMKTPCGSNSKGMHLSGFEASYSMVILLHNIEIEAGMMGC